MKRIIQESRSIVNDIRLGYALIHLACDRNLAELLHGRVGDLFDRSNDLIFDPEYFSIGFSLNVIKISLIIA